jgi:hypothetical protein
MPKQQRLRMCPAGPGTDHDYSIRFCYAAADAEFCKDLYRVRTYIEGKKLAMAKLKTV